MKSIHLSLLFIPLFVFLYSCQNEDPKDMEKSHPCLILQKSSVPDLKKGLTTYPILKATFERTIDEADEAIRSGIVVPFPKDESGGYTHAQHSRNYRAMYNAGLAYQLSGDEKYAVFVRDMLLAYAKMYPTLGTHPMEKIQAPGKLFWQGLNDSVWLLYTIQAYDCIYDYVTESDRQEIESNLFAKIVEFFIIEDSYSFNRIHNHGTWTVAGIGMAGMVMDRPQWVEQALYGTELDSTAGFIKQIDELFSPDGYYTEGPYYQQYALTPFLVFAQALENNRPNLKIFEYKDGVLIKAVTMLDQLTDVNGTKFPLNDAVKRKSRSKRRSESPLFSNIIYAQTGDKDLLANAGNGKMVLLSKEGLQVARDYNPLEEVLFSKKSLVVSDGSDGTEGGLAIIRAGAENDQSELVMKYATHGMIHGHFDRLTFCLYDFGDEIVPDYGAARFSNATVKFGGRYLTENKTWAKQTVAHNTVVIDEKSNFDNNMDMAALFHSDFLFADVSDENFQIVSAVDSSCYQEGVLQRTMAMIDNEHGRFVLDMFRVESHGKELVCDLPLYYQGQIMSSSFDYLKAGAQMNALGDKNGYQYLWVEASAKKLDGMASVCWQSKSDFYTWSFLTDKNTEFYFTRLGANDPDFNLRNEPGLMIRQKAVEKHTFFSVIELQPHADQSIKRETSSSSSIEGMEVIFQDENVTGVELHLIDKTSIRLFYAHQPGEHITHEVSIDGQTYEWEGNYKITEN